MRKTALLFILLAIVSCKKEKVNDKVVTLKVDCVSDLAVNSDCVFISKGNDNEVFINWTEELESGNVLVYKVFKNNHFQEKITISETFGLQAHNESMAKIVKTKNGVIYCLFRVSTPTISTKYGGILYYVMSYDDGATWSRKIKLVDDPKSSSQSFYDVTQLENGELGLIWLDNRFSTKKKRGSTLFFSRTDGHNGFQKGKPIAFNTCQCCRTDIHVENGEIRIAFRNIVNGKIRDIYFMSSVDNGENFSKADRISLDNWEINGCPHTGPSIASGETQTGVVWFTAGQGNKGLFFSRKNENQDKFDQRIEISKNGTHPQMTYFKGNYYIVYDEYYFSNDTTFQKIKLLKINMLGIHEIIDITQTGTMNAFPVIEKLNENQVIISWTNLDQNKKIIQYTTINI